MTSTRRTLVAMIVLGTAMAGKSNDQFAFGQQVMTEPPANSAQATAGNPATQNGATGPAAANAPKSPTPVLIGTPGFLGPRKRRHIANVNKLREMITEKVELSTAQKEEVNKVTDDFIAEIKKNPPMVPLPTVTMPDNAKAPIDLTPQWIEKLRSEMTPEQVETFQRTVESWKAISARMPILGPFLYLQRAIRDPELNLPPEQVTALDTLMDNTMWNVITKYPYLTDEVSAEVAEKGLVAVKEKLTPQQQAKVEAEVNHLIAEDKEIRESIKPGSNPIGGVGTAADTGECKPLSDEAMQKLKDKSLELEKAKAGAPSQP